MKSLCSATSMQPSCNYRAIFCICWAAMPAHVVQNFGKSCKFLWLSSKNEELVCTHQMCMTCFSWIVTLLGLFFLFLLFFFLVRCDIKSRLNFICVCARVRSPPAIPSQRARLPLSYFCSGSVFLLFQCSATNPYPYLSMDCVCVKLCGCSDDPSFLFSFIQNFNDAEKKKDEHQTLTT